MAEAVARWRDVSMKTEAGLVTGLAMYEELRRSGLKNAGSGSERSRADGAKTLGWTDVEAVEGDEWISGAAERTEGTYGKASCQRQEACGNTGLNSGGVTSIKELKVHPTMPSSPYPSSAATFSSLPCPPKSRSKYELLMAKGGGIDAVPCNRQPGARSIFKVVVTVDIDAAMGGM